MKQCILIINNLKFYHLLTQFFHQYQLNINLIRFNHQEFATLDLESYLTNIQVIILDCNDSTNNRNNKGIDKFNEEMILFDNNCQKIINHPYNNKQQIIIISNREMFLSYRYFGAEIPRVHYFTKPLDPQEFIKKLESLTDN
jgi:hypothetical protein